MALCVHNRGHRDICIHIKGGKHFMTYVERVFETVKKRNPNEPEFLQAVKEVAIFDDSYYGQVIHEIREMTVMNMGNYAHGNQPICLLYTSGMPCCHVPNFSVSSILFPRKVCCG